MIAYKGPVVASVGDSGFTCPCGLEIKLVTNQRRRPHKMDLRTRPWKIE